MPHLSKEDLEQVKKDMLDYYEGASMVIEVNIVADLVNEVEEYRKKKGE